VLCCLEGKSKTEAAADLGWREGTVSSRLARARALLQKRLARRGVALSGVLCAAGISPDAVPAGTLAEKVEAALSVAGRDGAGGVSARVVALAEEVMRAMCLTRWRTGILLALALGLLVGTGLTAHFGAGEKPPPGGGGREPGGPPAPQADRKQRALDEDGEALPATALLRLGKLRPPPGAPRRPPS